MMKNLLSFLLPLSVLLLIVGCASNVKTNPYHKTKIDPEILLNSDAPVERLDPFINREFKPWLENRWIGQAVSYGFYRMGQAPGVKGPSKAEILQDLHIIAKHWNLIRVYNADDDTERVLEVIRDSGLPIKVMLGIWLEKETDNPQAKKSNKTNVTRGIKLVNTFQDIVIAINVGNETQVYWSWHKLESDALIRYIRIVRSSTSVPITTADDYNFWNKPESASVASELDFLVVHAYPLWNGKTLDEAIPWLDRTFSEVQKVHPNKLMVLGEIGWATDYNANKKGNGEQGNLIKGEVSLEAQERFLTELDAWINHKQVCTFLFEVFDEPWKGGNTESNDIEKNWGVFYEDRSPKPSFTNHLARKNAIKKESIPN